MTDTQHYYLLNISLVMLSLTLQGFSDEAYYKAAAVCSEAQLHKQIGNSVSVPVIAAIGRRIVESLEEAGP